MQWKWKAFIQRLLSSVPNSEAANYLFQRYVTRSMPISDSDFIDSVKTYWRHVPVLKSHLSLPFGDAVFYEFGVGWDLHGPLTFYAAGINHQTVIDISRLAKPHLTNSVINQFKRIEIDLPLERKPETLVDCKTFDHSLHELYGIHYIAPCDARRTGLAANSIDCITSTFTFEHIPGKDISPIIKECRRILKPDGVMSFLIDYQDHYSYFDSSVNRYHYLYYSEKEWKRYNPSIHYQNRWRHPQYLKAFEEQGFEVVEDAPHIAHPNHLEELSKVELHPDYRSYDREQLAIRSSHIILKKTSSAG